MGFGGGNNSVGSSAYGGTPASATKKRKGSLLGDAARGQAPGVPNAPLVGNPVTAPLRAAKKLGGLTKSLFRF